jgi:hypothetical protein
MSLILLIGLAAQLPFAATSSQPYSIPPSPAVVLPPMPSEAQWRANAESLRQLFATTKSVMKRHNDAAPADQVSAKNAAANPAVIRDNQLVQATFNQAQTGQTGAQNDVTRPADTSPPASTSDADPPRSTTIDSETRAAANASAELLASALATPAAGALEGRPLPLADALGRGSTSVRRLEVAALYWKLSLATADYHWSLLEFDQLNALPGNKDPIDAPLLASALAATHAHVLEARAAAVTLQQELADAIGQPTQPLPLTVEQPLVGPYRTEFDTIFAGRAAPGRSRAIHRALPHWREAVDLRASAVQAAASAVPAAEEVFVKEKTGITTALFANQVLSTQRRAFLNAVRAYNAEIVEYASYVAGPTTSTATLVSMLTRSKPNKLSGGGASTSTFGGQNEPTVAPPQLDPNVQPAGGEERAFDRGWYGPNGAGGDPAAQSKSGAVSEPETNLQEIDKGRQD